MADGGKKDTTPDKINFIEGTLFEADGASDIPFLPVEVSRYTLSIVSKIDLEYNESLSLKAGKHSTKFRVKKKVSKYCNTQFWLFVLVADSNDINVEEVLQEIPMMKSWTNRAINAAPLRLAYGDQVIRATRFKTEQQLKINAKAIGENDQHQLETQNVSKSGMLVKNKGDKVAPFEIGAILELTVDPISEYFGEPLKCLAKVVRVDDKVGGNIAIQLIELEHTQMDIWSHFMEELEHNLTFEQ